MNIPKPISFVVILAVVGLVAYAKLRDTSFGDKPLTPEQRLERNVSEAKAAFAAAITNDVVGYHRTIKQDTFIGFGEAPARWWATATVEFVNKVGGIERTVVYYRFKPSFGSVELIRMTGDEFIEWAGIKTK